MYSVDIHAHFYTRGSFDIREKNGARADMRLVFTMPGSDDCCDMGFDYPAGKAAQ